MAPPYVRMRGPSTSPDYDVDIHALAATEGRRQLVTHLSRERDRKLVQKKKELAASLQCEVCEVSFGRVYGERAAAYCEVHHLVPLAQAEQVVKTRIEDLAILCSNCHRVVHLKDPPFTLEQMREMLLHERSGS